MSKDNFKGQVLQEVMPQKIDIIDKKILYILSKNCRISNTALAKALKIKRDVVAYRINQLLIKKIITGFFTLIDSRNLGFMVFTVYIKLRNVNDENEIIEYLRNKKEVTIVSSCSGGYDLYFYAATKKMEEFEVLISTFFQKYSPIVRDYVILNFLREDPAGNSVIFSDFSPKTIECLDITEAKGSTFNHEFSQLSNNDSSPSQNTSYFKIDETDVMILTILRFDARATLRDISEKVKITPNAVKSRISRLVSNRVIKCFTPLISFSSLGYQWFMILLNLVGVKESRLYKYAEQHPNIEWCIKCLGPWNYQLSVFASGNKEFHKVLNEIRTEFREEINHFETLIIFNQFKFEPRVE